MKCTPLIIRLVILITFVANTALASSTLPTPAGNSCATFFTAKTVEKNDSQQDVSIEAVLQRWRVLSFTKISDLFPNHQEILTANGDVKQVIVTDAASVKEFKYRWDKLLQFKERNKNIDAKKLRKYLKQKYGQPYPPLEGDLILEYQDYNLDQLITAFDQDRFTETEKIPPRIARRLLKTKADSLAYRIASRTSSWLMAKLKFFLVIGLLSGNLMTLGNSAGSTVVNPLVQTFNQVSAKWLEKPAAIETKYLSFLTAPRASDLKKNTSEIKKINDELSRYNFHNLTQDQAKEVWAGFEKRYFVIFQRFNKNMPSNLRDARNQYKDYILLMSIGLAANLSQFDTQHMIADHFLEELNDKISTRGTEPTAKELAKIQVYKDKMDDAERREAGALAAYKMIEFMYSEIGRDSGNEEDQLLAGSFSSFTRYMNFEKFPKEFAKQVADALTSIDKGLPYIVQLAQPDGSTQSVVIVPGQSDITFLKH